MILIIFFVAQKVITGFLMAHPNIIYPHIADTLLLLPYLNILTLTFRLRISCNWIESKVLFDVKVIVRLCLYHLPLKKYMQVIIINIKIDTRQFFKV